MLFRQFSGSEGQVQTDLPPGKLYHWKLEFSRNDSASFLQSPLSQSPSMPNPAIPLRTDYGTVSLGKCGGEVTKWVGVKIFSAQTQAVDLDGIYIAVA